MNRDDVLDLCANLPGAVEDYPFGDGVAVFKVGGRMFALVALDGNPGFVNLKCDPTLALELRALHSATKVNSWVAACPSCSPPPRLSPTSCARS